MTDSENRRLMAQTGITRALGAIARGILKRNEGEIENLVLVGIYTRGLPLAHRISRRIAEMYETVVPVGALEIGLHRDDARDGLRSPMNSGVLMVDSHRRRVIVVDDVFDTGRTLVSVMRMLYDYGRPQEIQFATLIDRGEERREMPVKADYIGKFIPTDPGQKIRVELVETDCVGSDQVVLIEGRVQTCPLFLAHFCYYDLIWRR